jgi:hypothetical protein
MLFVWQYTAMSQTFGMESPRKHDASPHRQPVRYVLVIESGGAMVARLYLDTREQVAEFDAAVEEVSSMINGIAPQVGAIGPEWDHALQGHSAVERSAAEVYTLAL